MKLRKTESTLNINKNININKHTRHTDDAEIIRAVTESKETKHALIAVIVIFALVLAVCFVTLLWINLREDKAEQEGKISAGYYDDLVGEDYKTVEAHFRAAGFTNIELVELDNAGIAFWKKGEVVVISVGGNTTFESGDYFDPDVKVIISYH